MNVEAINIGPSDAIAPVQAASALAGKGLQLTRSGIIKELIHRAGLNADILNDGRIGGRRRRRPWAALSGPTAGTRGSQFAR